MSLRKIVISKKAILIIHKLFLKMNVEHTRIVCAGQKSHINLII